MCDGGRDPYRWVSSFLQHVSLTQGLWFLQFSLASLQPVAMRPCLLPLVGRLRLEAPGVVDAAALALAAWFGIDRVPGQTALHQGSFLCVRTHL